MKYVHGIKPSVFNDTSNYILFILWCQVISLFILWCQVISLFNTINFSQKSPFSLLPPTSPFTSILKEN